MTCRNLFNRIGNNKNRCAATANATNEELLAANPQDYLLFGEETEEDKTLSWRITDECKSCLSVAFVNSGSGTVRERKRRNAAP